MTASRETVDFAIGDLLEELNDCKHHLQHNAKAKTVNQYLTKRIEELEQELDQACATAMAPIVGGLREEGPEASGEAMGGHCDCPKCTPPDEARWRLCNRRKLEEDPCASIMDSVAGMLGAALDGRQPRAGMAYSMAPDGGQPKTRKGKEQLQPTNRVRRGSKQSGRLVERLWQSADGTAGEWRAEAMDEGAPTIIRVF
jgi:hypothetical protein